MPITTPLDGGTQPVALGNGYELEAPGAVGTVTEHAGPRRTRGRGGIESDSPLDAALRRGGMAEVKAFEVRADAAGAAARRAPSRSRKRSASPGRTAEDLRLHVPVPQPGTAQVVMAIDQDGAVSWHLPEGASEGERETARVRRGAPRGEATQTFRIGNRLAPTADAGARAKRGLVGTIGKMVLKVLVYPITDPLIGPLGEMFAKRWEETHRPYGMYRMESAGSGDVGWSPMTDEDWRRCALGRALLLVHGTFSTAPGAFGALPRATMAALSAHYEGRVFAANHFTLSDDPADNARWIVEQVPPGLSLVVDIVCHSRGGLVARELLGGTAGEGKQSPMDVRRIVFVGAPNRGTLLADPDHMVSMIDRFTSALNIAPTGPITETLDAIITAVKVIGHGSLKSLRGLASMNPSGPYLAKLNEGGGGGVAELFGISADYAPPTEGGLFKLVAAKVEDEIVDRVFRAERNDLVVPTDSVVDGGGATGFPIPVGSSFVFPSTRAVMHTQYFAAPETGAHLLAWLGADVIDEADAPLSWVVEYEDHAPRASGAGFVQAYTPPSPRPRIKRAAPKATGPGSGDGGARTGRPRAGRGRDKDQPAPAVASTEDEGTEIWRVPSITSSKLPQVGKAFVFSVDLLFQEADPETESAGFTATGLSEQWEREKIDVRVDSPALSFAPGADSRAVYLERNAASTPAEFTATVRRDARADADGTIRVIATFYRHGRLCGNAARRFELRPAATRKRAARGVETPAQEPAGATDAPVRARDPVASSAGTTGTASIHLGAAAPKMTVVIFPPDDGGTMYWRVEISGGDSVPGLPDRRAEQCRIGRSAAEFVKDLYVDADELIAGDHGTFFNGIGEKLFEVTPACFKQAYWALRAHYGGHFPIQFVSGEPYIPWELMRPHDRASGRAESLLCIDHPVGRWLMDFEGMMTCRVPAGGVVTVAPDYAHRDVKLELPAAQEEADMLVADFKARRLTPATRRTLLALLGGRDEKDSIAVLHFAGHGAFDTGAANGSRVLLADADVRVNDVRTMDTQLGRRFGTFVVFNACAVGQATTTLGTIGGWAEAFLHERFGGFLAPLWPAYDEDARVVMKEFFAGAVRDKRPIGEVIRQIREAHAHESPTFLSYMYYGDVMAQFT